MTPPSSPPVWPWVRTVPRGLQLASTLTLLWGSGAMAQDSAPEVDFDLNLEPKANLAAPVAPIAPLPPLTAPELAPSPAQPDRPSPPPISAPPALAPDPGVVTLGQVSPGDGTRGPAGAIAAEPESGPEPGAEPEFGLESAREPGATLGSQPEPGPGSRSQAGSPGPAALEDDPSSLPPTDQWLWSPLDRSAPSASAPRPAPPAASPPAASSPPLPAPTAPPRDSLALSFALPALGNPIAPAPAVPPAGIARLAEDWWYRGSDSPLAIAIGAAEGTRTPQGDKTAAYYWHRDPGNGADNFGTFSYQHLPATTVAPVRQKTSTSAKRTAAAEAQLPELADRLQLERLQRFQDQLRQQAQAKGMTLNLVELINGLDLANQSEAAALSPWGYLDRLAQMRQRYPNNPSLQVLEARTWAYWSPERQAWDAPGLGNAYASIRRDQNRRAQAIAAALAHQGQHQEAIAQAILEFEDQAFQD